MGTEASHAFRTSFLSRRARGAGCTFALFVLLRLGSVGERADRRRQRIGKRVFHDRRFGNDRADGHYRNYRNYPNYRNGECRYHVGLGDDDGFISSDDRKRQRRRNEHRWRSGQRRCQHDRRECNDRQWDGGYGQRGEQRHHHLCCKHDGDGWRRGHGPRAQRGMR